MRFLTHHLLNLLIGVPFLVVGFVFGYVQSGFMTGLALYNGVVKK